MPTDTLPDFMSDFMGDDIAFGFETLTEAEAATISDGISDDGTDLSEIENKLDAIISNQAETDQHQQDMETELEKQITERMAGVEKLILPFLYKLYKNADNTPIIKWPNRGPQIIEHINKIVALTRGPQL